MAPAQPAEGQDCRDANTRHGAHSPLRCQLTDGHGDDHSALARGAAEKRSPPAPRATTASEPRPGLQPAPAPARRPSGSRTPTPGLGRSELPSQAGLRSTGPPPGRFRTRSASALHPRALPSPARRGRSPTCRRTSQTQTQVGQGTSYGHAKKRRDKMPPRTGMEKDTAEQTQRLTR